VPRDQQNNQPASLPESLLAALRKLGGDRAAFWGDQLHRSQVHIPTGFEALDGLLGGGLPRGALSELLGRTTSGMTTIALTLIAHAQRRGDAVVFVDLGHTFDAEYAAACGVDLAALVLVQPVRVSEALETIHAFVASRAVGVLVADALALVQERAHGRRQLTKMLDGLQVVLPRTPCTFVALTPQPFSLAMRSSIDRDGSALAHAATLRLQVERLAWLPNGEAHGSRARVTVLRQRGVPPGATVELDIPFADHEAL
jgi:recombination protein RecA